MPRALRLMFNVSAAASAAFLLLSAFEWPRTHFASDLLDFRVRRDFYHVIFVDGCLVLKRFHSASSQPGRLWLSFASLPPGPGAVTRSSEPWARFGFIVIRDPFSPGQDELALPLWFVALLSAPLPAGWLLILHRRRRLRYRQAHNLCTTCGYDLRASKLQCPECGNRIPEPDP